jgi:hypothetical protein
MNNGTILPPPELTQTAVFDNHAASTNVPYVTMAVTPNSIGPVLPSSRTFKATVTTSSTWPPSLVANNLVTFSFLANSSFQGTFTPTSCAALNANSACSVNFTTSQSTPAGVYHITVLAHYVSNDRGTTNLQSDTLAFPYAVQFIVFDYKVSLSPLQIQAAPGTTVSAIATITSINGFSGSGNLSITVATGLSVSVAPTTFALPAGGFATENLFMHQTAAIPTFQRFGVRVSALIGNQTRLGIVIITFDGFSLTPASSSMSFNSGSSLNDTILIQSLPMSTLLGYSGAVTFANSTSPSSGLTVNCNASPNPIVLNAGGSASINCKFSSFIANTYIVTFTGTGGNPAGSISNSTTIVVTVEDFSLSVGLGYNSVTISPGGVTDVGLYLKSILGFAGAVQVSASAPPGINVQFLYPTAMTLSATSPPNPVCWASPNACNNNLYVSADITTPRGTYTVIFTATSGSLSHHVQLIVNVV